MKTVHWSAVLTCPHCFSTTTADFSLVEGKSQPEAGDVFLCSFCSQPSVYGERMDLEMPTREQLDELEGSEGYAQARETLGRRQR